MSFHHRSDSPRTADVVTLRGDAAVTLHRLGATPQALELARAELAAAWQTGSPRAVALALRALGLIEQRPIGIALLEQAARLIVETGSRGEQAHTLVALGAALRRAGRRRDARQPLQQALELAAESGDEPLAAEAQAELATLEQPPRAEPPGDGATSLTASERRVCELAAAGRSNPEIARSLFVSRATVETHLHHAYRKLDIGSRYELGGALAA